MCFQIIPLCPGCEEPSGLGEEIIYAEDICSGHCTGDDVVGTTTRLMTRYEVDHCYDDDNAADAAVATVTTPVSIFEDDDEDDDDENDSSFSPPRQQGTTAGGGGASSKRFFECLTPGCDAVAVAAADGGDPEGFRRLSAEEEEQEVQGARDHAKVFLREKYENCLSLCILPFVEAPVRLVLSSIQVSWYRYAQLLAFFFSVFLVPLASRKICRYSTCLSRQFSFFLFLPGILWLTMSFVCLKKKSCLLIRNLLLLLFSDTELRPHQGNQCLAVECDRRDHGPR